MPHTVRLNNFVAEDGNSRTDFLSKMFIILEWSLGLNRVTVLTNLRLIQFLSCLYSSAVISSVIYLSIALCRYDARDYVEFIKMFQYIVTGILGFTSRKKICIFYDKINTFDFEVGCKPKVSQESCLIILSMIVLCSFILISYAMADMMQKVPSHWIFIIEYHYFGFLFNILNQRLHLINGSLKSTLISYAPFCVNMKTNAFIVVGQDGKTLQIAMHKLMDFYYSIIGAYDLLIDAIKWQLLFITTTSFLYTVCISYQIAIMLLRYDAHPLRDTIMDALTVGSEILPLMAPCMCCDILRYQVRKLRELLASKLFESKLDKSNRSVARALLALTKARNLSFSLLRMVDISISLPFSYIGLLATYLIILLQFEKVIINPNNYATSTPQP